MASNRKVALPRPHGRLSDMTEDKGFSMPSGLEVGALLRVLAASKPGGRLLELGTGTGLATAFLLDGMDAAARLVSVDTEASCQAIAREGLGDDARVRFECEDAAVFIAGQEPCSFDLVFADAWPGKFSHLDETLDRACCTYRWGGFTARIQCFRSAPCRSPLPPAIARQTGPLTMQRCGPQVAQPVQALNWGSLFVGYRFETIGWTAHRV